MKKNGILAADSGGITGWAYAWPGDPPVYGHVVVSAKDGDPGAAFSRLRRWLLDTIDAFDPAVVAVEQPVLDHGKFRTSLQTAMRLMGYYALMMQVCHERQIRFEPVRVGDVKKYMTGYGNATKDEMVEAARLRGWPTETSDEADALGVLILAERRLSRIHRPVPVGPLFGGALL